jgi:hypothetical protein
LASDACTSSIAAVTTSRIGTINPRDYVPDRAVFCNAGLARGIGKKRWPFA